MSQLRNFLLGAAALGLFPGALPALACDGNESEQWAFARKSPLSVVKDGVERSARVEFSRALPVLKKSKTAAIICVDNQRVRMQLSELVLVSEIEKIGFRQGSYRTSRPNIGFWSRAERLADHLDLSTKANAAPDWQETTQRIDAIPKQLPLLKRSGVQSSFGEKKVLQVLLPVSGRALAAYRAMRERERKKIVPIVVLDGSQTASVFFARFWQQIQSADAFERFATAQLTAVTLTSNKTPRVERDITLGELVQRLPSGDNADQDGFSKALEAVWEDQDKAVVWGLLGGDKVVAAKKNAEITVFQMTPELDPELEQSAKENSAYYPFAPDHSSKFFELAESVPGFEQGGREVDDVNAIKEAQSESGFLAFLPNTDGAETDLMAGSAELDWQAFEVWIVDNSTVFGQEF